MTELKKIWFDNNFAKRKKKGKKNQLQTAKWKANIL